MLLNGPFRDHEGGRDSSVGTTLGHEREHLTLSPAQARQRVDLPRGAEELRDHFGVQRGAAGCDPHESLYEVAHVRHPVLQQVADAGGAVGQ